jgi:hypothetical protein
VFQIIQNISIVPAAACLLAAGLAPAAAQTATEAQKEALRSHCRTDFLAHCSGVRPGGIPAFECLEKNLASLSAACQAAVEAVDPQEK